jgi:hypothetical protein
VRKVKIANSLLGKYCQKLIANEFAEKTKAAAGQLAAEPEFKIVPSG